jgi:lipopolysaccharide/colanic/teichoic acid biosynthesis glycosyltransferase
MKTFALGVVKAPDVLPKKQQYTRILDLFLATLGLVLAAPVMLMVAFLIKLSDKGPVFYRQERVGRGGKLFTMYKFRSMRQNAEPQGPALASDNDPRTTGIGKVLRKWRLDELPQLWNVVKGDMAMVGPRPERQYFIDRIMDHAPNYGRLLELRPGLTSMGIVRFGYASSVEEMIDRQRHDQYYFENRSIVLDLRILVQSVQVVLGRKGK